MGYLLVPTILHACALRVIPTQQYDVRKVIEKTNSYPFSTFIHFVQPRPLLLISISCLSQQLLVSWNFHFFPNERVLQSCVTVWPCASRFYFSSRSSSSCGFNHLSQCELYLPMFIPLWSVNYLIGSLSKDWSWLIHSQSIVGNVPCYIKPWI